MVNLPLNQMWMDSKMKLPNLTLTRSTIMMMQIYLISHLMTISTYPVQKFRGSIIHKFKPFRGGNTIPLLILDLLLHKSFRDYIYGPRIILRTKLMEIQTLVYKLNLPQVFKMNVISRNLSQWLNPNPSNKH